MSIYSVLRDSTGRVPRSCTLAAALSILMIGGTLAQADVLVNGGFEAGLSGWTALELGQGATVAPSSEAHTGSGSALILTHGAQLPGYAAISQEAKVTAGARYCLRLSVLQAGDEQQGGGFGVSVYQNAAAVDLLIYGAPGEWVSQRACFVSQAESVSVTVYAAQGLSAGGGNLDSVSLTEVAPYGVATPAKR